MLATSRRPLGVDGEFVLPVPPLPDRDAVALFADRARSAGAALGEAGAHGRGRGHLPPARRPAARHRAGREPAAGAGPAGAGDPPGRPAPPRPSRRRLRPRQRSLHDMVSWSYDLLPPATRRVFDRLGVFSSSLTLEAAEAVCQHDDVAHDDEVARRVAHETCWTTSRPSSTTRCSPASPGRRRPRATGSSRRCASSRSARLTDAGQLVAARRAHADYFQRLATTAGAASYGPDELVWRGRMEAEEPNLQAALSWTAANEPRMGMRLAVALWPYWDMRWGEREAVAHLERLLADPELAGADRLRAWGLTVAADLAANPGDARRSLPWAHEAVEPVPPLGRRVRPRVRAGRARLGARQPGCPRRSRRGARRGHGVGPPARRRGPRGPDPELPLVRGHPPRRPRPRGGVEPRRAGVLDPDRQHTRGGHGAAPPRGSRSSTSASSTTPRRSAGGPWSSGWRSGTPPRSPTSRRRWPTWRGSAATSVVRRSCTTTRSSSSKRSETGAAPRRRSRTWP